jgi:hypothetical protein
MVKYYHIHRGINKSNIEKSFINNKPFFFSRKNSFFYNFEVNISEEYNGYRLYEIYIPNTLFTTSFNPKSKNKIVKVRKHNLEKYIELKEKYKGHDKFIVEMNKRNIIGIDYNIKKWNYKDTYGPPEGYIWSKPNDIIITCIKTVNLTDS